MPSGIEQNYDCYNFCGGIWVSSCDYSGQCGTTTCDNSTATGTMNGEVQGCTYKDFVDYQAMGGAAAPGSPSSGGAAVLMLPPFAQRITGSVLVILMMMIM